MTTIEKLYQDHKNQVYGYCYSLLKNPQEAQDLTAQTFETAIHKINQTQGHQKHLSWLLTIARNHINNHWRKKKFTPASQIMPEGTDFNLDHLIPDHKPTPLESTIQKELLEQVNQALKQLPPLQREVIILRHWHCLTFDEIKDLINTTLRVAKYRYYSGLEKLKAILLETDEEKEKLWFSYFFTLDYISQCTEYIPASTLDKSIQPLLKDTTMNSSILSLTTASNSKIALLIGGSTLITGLIVGNFLLNNDSKKDNNNSPNQTQPTDTDNQNLATTRLSQSLSSPLTLDQLDQETSSTPPVPEEPTTPPQNQTPPAETALTIESVDLFGNKTPLTFTMTLPSQSTYSYEENYMGGTQAIIQITDQGQMILNTETDGSGGPIDNPQEVGQNPDYGKIYRSLVNTSRDQTQWYYTNQISFSPTDCQAFENATACGNLSIAKNQQTFMINLTCSTDDPQILPLCDQIALNLQQQK